MVGDNEHQTGRVTERESGGQFIGREYPRRQVSGRRDAPACPPAWPLRRSLAASSAAAAVIEAVLFWLTSLMSLPRFFPAGNPGKERASLG